MEVHAAMIRRFSIKQVAERTGLDESEIRSYESVFREFLASSESGLGRGDFSEEQIAVLNRVKELVRKRGFSVEEVRRELRAGIQEIRAGGGAPVRGPGSARVIAVTSGKGGVGKTSLVVNLALAIARTGKRVAVFDADLGLANVHILMGIRPRFSLAHMVRDGFSLEDVLSEGPDGIRIISGGQGAREMANLNEEQRRLLLRQLDRLEREVDVLLVDTGAGISENVLRFATFADEVIAVTTPNLAANADCFSIISILLEMEPRSKIGLVTNMARDMYEAKNTFNRLQKAAETRLHYRLQDLGYVADCPAMRSAAQARRPVLLTDPDSASARSIGQVAATLLSTRDFTNEEKKPGFGDLMGALKRDMTGTAAAAF